MRQYYYLIGTEKMGPYGLEELKAKNISRDTLVWHNDLEDWTPAHRVDELKSMYQLTPPEIKPQSTQAQPPPQPSGSSSYNQGSNFDTSRSDYRPPMPKNYLTEAILVTIFCCIPLGIVGIINASNVESRYRAGDYEGAEKAAKDAALWTKIGFWSVFVLGGLYFIFVLIVAVASA